MPNPPPSTEQMQSINKAIEQLAVGNVSLSAYHLAGNTTPLPTLDRPPLHLGISRYGLPPLLRDILDPSASPVGPADPSHPNCPAIDIAGLVLLGLQESTYDLATNTTTYQWAADPFSVIDQARNDPWVSLLQSPHKPVLSAPVCALLSEFAYISCNRPAGFSIANFNNAIKAGYEVGDPHILAVTVFNSASEQSVNRQRLKAVLPHFPKPMPGTVRDILWSHALRADNFYNSVSPAQGAKLRGEPGYCQQLLIDHDIVIAVDPETPSHSDVVEAVFRYAADHLVPDVLACLANHQARPDGDVLVKVVNGMAGNRYTDTEQKRIVRMIDGFGFQARDTKVLSLPLPGRKGNTPLHCMVSDGSFLIARKLIEMGASTSALNKARETPLMCSKKRSQKMLQHMLALSAMAPMQDNERQFMLFKACRTQDVGVACSLMDQGANLLDRTPRQKALDDMFTDMLKMSDAKHQKAQARIQKILAHHVSLRGDLSLGDANLLLVLAARSACDSIVNVALAAGARPDQALADGLGNLYPRAVNTHIDRFISIMTSLASAGLDPEYYCKSSGELLFGKMWKFDAFSRAAEVVKQSRQLEQSVDAVPTSEAPTPPHPPRPRF